MEPKQRRPPVKTRARAIVARERREKTLELRIGGASERQIAAELDLSRTHVHRILVESIEELNVNNREKAEHVRRIELERLDKLTLALFAGRSNPRNVDSLLRIMERRARLLGLDAPTKQELTGAEGGPLEFTDRTEEVRAKLLKVIEDAAKS